MPAPRPIRISHEDPTLLGSLAAAAGRARFEQLEQDRFDRDYARDLAFVSADLDRRAQAAALDNQYRGSLRNLQRRAQVPPTAGGVQTFTREGRVPPGASPTALRDADARVRARGARSAQAVQQAGSPLGRAVRDPTAPDTGYGAIVGPNMSTFTAGGQMATGPTPQQAAEDYRAMAQATGQSIDPNMLQAMSAPAQAPTGGYVGPGQQQQVPAHVAGQLSVLAPYQNTLLPEDFAGLEAAVRSGQIDDMNQLVNQIEDAQGRRQSLMTGGQDDRLERMTLREHQLEIARLRRHMAQSLATDPYGEVNTQPYLDLINRHEQAINQLTAPANGGESGSGGPPPSGMIVVTNGQETYRIPAEDLGQAQAEGFREVN